MLFLRLREGFYNAAVHDFEKEALLLLEAKLNEHELSQKLIICRNAAINVAASAEVAGKPELSDLDERLKRYPEKSVEVELYLNGLSEYARSHSNTRKHVELVNIRVWAQAAAVYMAAISKYPDIPLNPQQHGQALKNIQEKGERTQAALINWRQNTGLFKHLFSRYRKALETVIDQIDLTIFSTDNNQSEICRKEISRLLLLPHTNWQALSTTPNQTSEGLMYDYDQPLKHERSLMLQSSPTAILSLPNGKIAIGLSDGTIEIREFATLTCLKPLCGHSNAVHCLALLPDGRLASGGYDKTVRLWNLQSGQSTILREHDSPVYSLVALENGQLVSGADGIRIWETSNGKCKKTLKGQGNIRSD